MVTHDQEEALAMADRIVVMNHGVIEQVGTPKDIYERPASRFVAEFVGSMNFIRASFINNQQIRIEQNLLKKPPIHNINIIEGDFIDLAIRPEMINFSGQSDDTLPVLIKSAEFQGHYDRYECQLANGLSHQHIYVDTMRGTNKKEIQVGDYHYIQLPKDNLLGFKAII